MNTATGINWNEIDSSIFNAAAVTVGNGKGVILGSQTIKEIAPDVYKLIEPDAKAKHTVARMLELCQVEDG